MNDRTKVERYSYRILKAVRAIEQSSRRARAIQISHLNTCEAYPINFVACHVQRNAEDTRRKSIREVEENSWRSRTV